MKTLRHTVIDGAEGTLRQFFLQPPKNGGRTLKVSQVSKIFVTHMHRKSVTKYTPSNLSNHATYCDLQRTTSWVSPPFYAASWDFLILKISRRAVLRYVYLTYWMPVLAPTKLRSHNVAEGQSIRPRRSSLLRPHYALPDTYTNCRPLCGSRASHPNRPTHALRQRGSTWS
jgi:hypothetical protein